MTVAADPDILDRTLEYSLRAVLVFRELESDTARRILGRQFLRSATSIGANVHEAQAGQSKPDFIAKISIAHKERVESLYWLQLIGKAAILPAARLSAIVDETDQLTRILAAILVKSKRAR